MAKTLPKHQPARGKRAALCVERYQPSECPCSAVGGYAGNGARVEHSTLDGRRTGQPILGGTVHVLSERTG